MARAPITHRTPPQGTDHTLSLDDGIGTDDKHHPPVHTPENLEPAPVYTPPPPKKPKKDRPEMPGRFLTGGATAEEREQWMKDNWGD